MNRLEFHDFYTKYRIWSLKTHWRRTKRVTGSRLEENRPVIRR
jgi:hypothetical protein